MPLKTVILNGSPRKKGNTAIALEQLENALRARNFEQRRFDLWSRTFRGCAHCNNCKKNEAEHNCALKDDMQEVLDAIVGCEVLVLASPVYCWAVSGCLSTALDRFYSLYKPNGSLITGKKVIGLFTSGGDAFDGMELCVSMASRIATFGRAEYAGTLAISSLGTPQETRLKAESIAREARLLVEKL